ncbi:MAG: transposase [Nitrososphaerales archaeon]|jgi:putative transposase
MTIVLKSIKQSYFPTKEVIDLMETFRSMVNWCIRKGLETGATSMKRLCSLSYKDLGTVHSSVPAFYRLTAISRAAGILAARKKSLRRGVKTRDPHLTRSVLISCYNFKIEKGSLIFPISKGKRINICLSRHTLDAITDLEVRSFVITPTSVTLSVRKNVESYVPKSFVGVDRNASNVTFGNEENVLKFNLCKVEKIARRTRDIVGSFKRNDVRIRKSIASKYGMRRKERVNQILHIVSKNIVEEAKLDQSAIVFEDIKDIRNLYKRGNYQGPKFRGRMNSVPWYEIQRQIRYKAAWEGVPVVQLTKGETRGTSKLCPVCGERLQEDRIKKRQLWCGKCKKWEDRDGVAVMNISRRGWLRFRQSKGEASDAMVQEPRKEGVILQVDASKLSSRLQPKT